MKKFGTVLCNPPYNAGNAQSPIYQDFLEKFKSLCEQSAWLFPNTWIGNPNWATSKTVRSTLDALGVYHVLMCPKSVFEPQARVTTCVCYCDGNLHDNFVFESRTTRDQVVHGRKTLLKEKIPVSYKQEEIDLLVKMQEFGGERINGFDCKDETWKIGPYNVNPNRKPESPLGKIVVLDPEKKPGWMTYKWMNFWEGDSRDDAEEIMPRIESFWYSKLITFILNKTWISYTLGPPIFVPVPLPDYSRLWTDEELYEKYGLTEEEISLVEDNYLISDAN